MAQGVLHGSRLGVARIEEHEHEVREPDDVVGDPQHGGALLVGVEARGVDDDLAAELRARTRFELEVGVDAAALAGRDLLDVAAHLVERKPGVRVEGEAGRARGGPSSALKQIAVKRSSTAWLPESWTAWPT